MISSNSGIRGKLYTLTLSAGIIMYAASAALAVPTPEADTTVTINGTTWYVYTNGVTGGITGASGDHIQLGSGGSGPEIGGSVFGATGTSGSVANSAVSADHCTVDGKVYGGNVDNVGDVTGASVTMTNSSADSEVYGGYTGSGNVTSASVTMTNSRAGLDVHGGSVNSGDVKDISVTVTSCEINGAYGGFIHSGNVTSASVTITMTNSSAVYGGLVYSGDVTNAAVTMTDSRAYAVDGGSVNDSGNVTNATVSITSGEISGYVTGGHANIGDVKDTSVDLTNISVVRDVFGGLVNSGDVKDASVTMTNSSADYVYGGYTDSGSVTSASVTMINSSADGDVVGGHVVSGSVTNAAVSIKGGEIGGEVYGGAVSNDGSVTGASVTMINSSADGEVYGGYTGSGSVTSASVTMTGSSADYVYGGHVFGSGDVKDVSASITGGRINHGVYGAEITDSGSVTGVSLTMTNSSADLVYGADNSSGDVKDVSVAITGSNIVGAISEVAGGYVWNSGSSVTSASVTMTDSHTGKIYGGRAEGDGSMTGTSVAMTNSSADYAVYGGYVGSDGSVTNAAVTITSGELGGEVYGGEVWNDGSVSNAAVTITSGEIGGEVYGGEVWNDGSVNGASVTMTNSRAGGTVYGGAVWNDGNVTSASVTMTNSSADYVHGGYTDSGSVTNASVTLRNSVADAVFGGRVNSGDVTNATVSITSGEIAGPVFGGYANTVGSVTNAAVSITSGEIGSSVYGGFAYSGSVEGATVNLNSGSVGTEGTPGRVYAGFIATGSGSAVNGTINLRGSFPYAELYGGGTGDSTGDLVTGNTLNVYDKNLQALSAQNFQYLNFHLPADISAGETILTLTGSGLTVPVIGTTVNTYASGVTGLRAGDELTLLSGKIDTSAGELNTVEGTIEIGISKEYKTVYETQTENADSDYVRIKVVDTGRGLKSQTKSLAETAVFSSALAAGGADALVNSAMDSAEIAARARAKWMPYANMGYSDMRYDSGSHIDANGWNLNLGAARRFISTGGELLVGPFFEYGRSDYDSYSEGIHADGDGHFTGGGIFVRQKNNNGFYYEGSVRGGRVKADYKTDGMNGGTVHEEFEYDTNYWAFHVGVGKEFELKNRSRLNAYLRYFYTHQNDFSAPLSSGETYDFDDVTSSVIRAGARWSREVNDYSTLYAGLAYQYEFDSEAAAHFDGDSTLSPSLEGSSGMLELGWQVRPKKDGNMAVDVGVAGWAGKKRGVNFHAGVKWDL